MMFNLKFKQVSSNDMKSVDRIFQIIKACGEDMFENQGLEHWKTPYPVASIRKDCETKAVFLVIHGDLPVATFSLLIDDGGVLLTKFAVAPAYSGQKIGTRCIEFIEDWCREKQINRIHLDVYDKSSGVICFYEHNGFQVYGSAPTRRFQVLLMEKDVL